NEVLRKIRFRRSDACGRGRDGRRGPCGRRWSQGGRGSRDGACAPVCWVDKSASRVSSPLTGQFACWIEIKSGDAGKPKMGHLRPKRAAPGKCRAIADNCAAYTGATCFRQSGQGGKKARAQAVLPRPLFG